MGYSPVMAERGDPAEARLRSRTTGGRGPAPQGPRPGTGTAVAELKPGPAATNGPRGLKRDPGPWAGSRGSPGRGSRDRRGRRRPRSAGTSGMSKLLLDSSPNFRRASSGLK